jgi:hypothetical protein
MIDQMTIAQTYLAAWNAPGEAERQAQLERWSADARYVDPLMQGQGREGIGAMIAAARAQFPGHSFALAGTPDGHGSHVRFSWDLLPGEGAPVARGTDIVRVDDDGRIAEVVGFLDAGAA